MMMISFGCSAITIASSLELITRLPSNGRPGIGRLVQPVEMRMFSPFDDRNGLGGIGHFDLAVAQQRSLAPDVVDLVLLEEELDPARELVRDAPALAVRLLAPQS